MKFKVIGYSKDNGHKVNMEVEAQSKAEAERRAVKSNLEVVRVELQADADVHNATLPGRPAGASPLAGTGVTSRPTREELNRHAPRSGFRNVLILILIAAVAAGAWMYWDKVVEYLPMLKRK